MAIPPLFQFRIELRELLLFALLNQRCDLSKTSGSFVREFFRRRTERGGEPNRVGQSDVCYHEWWVAHVVALSVGRAVRLRERRESLRASDADSFPIPGELDAERPSDQLD